MIRTALTVAALALATTARSKPAAPTPNTAARLPAIVDEGLNHSQVMVTAGYLCSTASAPG